LNVLILQLFNLHIAYSHSTRLLAATTLRNVLGTKNLAEILSERETISQVMQNALDEATDPWGVKVTIKKYSWMNHLKMSRYFLFVSG
jgi:regulator of protease activity HflC (stomatin/prohibitin superfamily)